MSSAKETVPQALADEIGIPPGMAEEARDRFASIARWTEREASTLASEVRTCTRQRSFSLGTVFRPLGTRDQYDADMVCTLRAVSMTETFQANLKADVGHEVRFRASAHGIQQPVEGRRCQKLEHADDTSLGCGILASVPAPLTRGALSVGPGLLSPVPELPGRTPRGSTDREHPDYDRISSGSTMANPKHCEAWFKERQRHYFEDRPRTRNMQDGTKATVENLPLQDGCTSLQDAIKLLKRHRVQMFQADGHKPILIIAPGAAPAYGGQATIVKTLSTVLPLMASFIEHRDGIAWVQHPACPSENLAGRGTAAPRKAENPRTWLLQVQRGFAENLRFSRADALPDELRGWMTGTDVAKVLPRFALATPVLAIAVVASAEEEAGLCSVLDDGGAPRQERWTGHEALALAVVSSANLRVSVETALMFCQPRLRVAVGDEQVAASDEFLVAPLAPENGDVAALVAYQVRIVLDSPFPAVEPIVTETGNAILRSETRHLNGDGTCCVLAWEPWETTAERMARSCMRPAQVRI